MLPFSVALNNIVGHYVVLLQQKHNNKLSLFCRADLDIYCPALSPIVRIWFIVRPGLCADPLIVPHATTSCALQQNVSWASRLQPTQRISSHLVDTEKLSMANQHTAKDFQPCSGIF